MPDQNPIELADPADPADPDDVLHHITVADVETLYGMVLLEGQAEQVKERLARALSNAINEIKGIGPVKDYLVAYEVRTGIDGSVVHDASVTVSAVDKKTARAIAVTWVQTYDSYYDDRIDPRVVIVTIARTESRIS